MQIKNLNPWIIFFSGTFLFLIGVQSQEIISFESRFYLFALEMWRHGFTWFPTTYLQPYPDYPVTSTLLIYLTSCLFGTIDKFTAVLPSAVASAATLSFTYLIGASHNPKWGWCSVFFLLFTLTFVSEARTISLDQFVTLTTVMTFYFAFIKRVNVIYVGLLFALGFAFRGPIGVVIPAGIVCISYLVDSNFKRFFMIGFIAVSVLIVCSLLLTAIAYHAGGLSFVKDVLRMQVIGRMNDVSTLPFLFYFKESFGAYAVTYPLAILIALGFVFSRHNASESKLFIKCIVWCLVILIGLSIPAEKKIRYILPMTPGLALVCGYLYINYKQSRYLNTIFTLLNKFCFIFPIIVLTALYILSTKQIFIIEYFIASVAFVGLQVVIIIMRKKPVVILGLAALSFLLANIFIVEAINLQSNKTLNFVLTVEQLRDKTQAQLLFYSEGSDGLPIKYIAHMPHEEMPSYLYEENKLLHLKKSAIVIMSEENFLHLSRDVKKYLKVIMHGKIGHDEVVVLQSVKIIKNSIN